MNVAEAIARTLVDEGVDAVFSLLGDGTMHIVLHLAELGIPVYETRHEAIAVAMADGYSRSTGKVGLCAITGGPALAHTLVPLTSAARTDSQVIVLTGPSSRDDLTGRQQFDHGAMTTLAGAQFRPIHSADVAVERTREAVDVARIERSPVVLDVTEEIQQEAFEWDVESRPTPAWRTAQRIHPDPVAIDEAVRLIDASERPVVLAGRGAVASGAREALLDLAAHAGAVVGTALDARGLFHGDPFDAGVAGLYSTPGATEVYGGADLVVSFGASLNAHTTVDGYLFPEARVVQVDILSPRPMRSGETADCYVHGDALAVARALRERVSAGQRHRTDEVAALLATDPDPWDVDLEDGLVDPRALCAALDELLPPECGWASGNSGHFWAFPIMHMPRRREPMIFSTYFGAIGYGIPVGLGAAIGHPDRPMVVFEGDASTVMYVQAIETAARYGARMLIVALNDQVLGAEYHKLVARGIDPTLSRTPDLDLAAVATSLGCPGVTLTDLDRLPAIVEQFLEGDGPLFVDARVSPSVPSRPTRRTEYGLDD